MMMLLKLICRAGSTGCSISAVPMGSRRTTRSSGIGAIFTPSVIMPNGRRPRCRSPAATRWACRPCPAIPFLSMREDRMKQDQRIAIVGGGLAGLATAHALKTFGIKADVYEQAPALGEIGAAVNASPNANKALIAIGLGEEIAAVGQFFARHLHAQHADRRLPGIPRPAEDFGKSTARRTTPFIAPISSSTRQAPRSLDPSRPSSHGDRRAGRRPSR